MTAEIKEQFLQKIESKYGQILKIGSSLSLFKVQGSDILIYTRYSKIHEEAKTFYGLRQNDLKLLEGHPSVICFLWDDQENPLIIPFEEFEDVFNSISPAGDGQYKVQIYLEKDKTELYIPTIGRFGVDSYFGWHEFERMFNSSNSIKIPELDHSQVQTIIGSIGYLKDFDVWIPQSNRSNLDWNIASRFQIKDKISIDVKRVKEIIEEVDVIWFRNNNEIHSLFEVEHSTPIYSGLLRFNDIHLEFPNLRLYFNIVANIERKSLFTKQLNRPTFYQSGLNNLCTFYDYSNIYSWYCRLRKGEL